MYSLLKHQDLQLLQVIGIMLHPEINKQHQHLLKSVHFFLKNNKMGDVNKLTPVTP